MPGLCFCISDYCRSQVMKVCSPVDWTKLYVVRLGVDLQVFAPNLDQDRCGVLEIVCVGRFVPAKGHLVLLRGFSSLLQRGHTVRLRLIGDGEERKSLEASIASEKLEASVILEGALSHEATRQRLAHADVFVLASFAEGLPVALMEAMAMGIPCVSTFVAGIPELVRDGVEGLLVPPSSARELSAALERLVSDPELRRRLGEKGRIRVEQLYDLRKNVGLLADTLQSQITPSS